MFRLHAKRILLNAISLLLTTSLAAQGLLLINPSPTDPKLLQGSWKGAGPGGECSVTISGNSLIYTQPSSANSEEPFRYKTEFVLVPDTSPQQLYATIVSDGTREQAHVGTIIAVIFMIENGDLKLGVINSFETTPTAPVSGDWETAIDKLPIVRPLPAPFAWSDESGRSTKFSDWNRRRTEIKTEIEHYGIGKKPTKPDEILASYEDNTLTVQVTVGGNSLTLTSKITLPEGAGPFPAVIGIGRGSESLPSELFSDRDIAQIGFNFSRVMSHTQTRGNEPINALYPHHTYIGAYSAWSWGISRIIDGLELVSDDLRIDLKHLAVTGCSFAGKMALFAGAFDERIALTIAQESGGCGAAAWRVSETLGNVETLGSTSSAWFIEDMFRFSNAVPKLPYDHHELMAMVAPALC